MTANSISSLAQSLAPLSAHAASNAKALSTNQAVDSADSFVRQLLASCRQQQGGKPGVGLNSNNSASLVSMLKGSSASLQNVSLYSVAPASLYSMKF